MSKLLVALVDCNNFFVSCERALQPALETKPVLVLSSNDGCVISRSAEVKALGIQMGEPYFQCKEVLNKNQVKVFSSNFTLYGDLSQRVMETLETFVEDMEVYSIDEAFLNLTSIRQPVALCRKIRKTVRQWTRIPVSIGLAPTKVLAKVANHIAKKNPVYGGVFELTLESSSAILATIPVGEIWGIGRQSAKLLHDHRIDTALQLRDMPDAWLKKNLSVQAVRIAHELRGTPCFSLAENPTPKKGIVCSRSFGKTITSLKELEEAVATYASRAAEKLREEHQIASYIHVYVRTRRFNQDKKYANSNGAYLPVSSASTPVLITAALALVRSIFKPGFAYAKAGVSVSGLTADSLHQQSLFTPFEFDRHERLMRAYDGINRRFGGETIKYAATGTTNRWQTKNDFVSKRFTTSFKDIPVAH